MYEKVNGPNLNKFLNILNIKFLEHEIKHLLSKFAIWVLEDSINALLSLDKKGLIHKDLKPDNLMINIISKEIEYTEEMLY